MRLASTIKYDVKIQFRSGFYFAYLIVCLIYIAAVRQLPINIKSNVTTIIVFLDPSILGFYFIGGLILLEKKQNILSGLFVTPLSVPEYLISKAISLTLLAWLSSLVIVFFILGTGLDLILFSITIILTSIMFVFFGLTLVAKIDNINEYLITSPLPLIFFILPLFDYLEVLESDLFYLLPSHAVIKLLSSAIEGIQTSLLNFIPLIIWLFIAFFWAYHCFNRNVVEKTGS